MANGDGEVVGFDNVGLRYGTGKEVLSDVSFTLFPGSFYLSLIHISEPTRPY